MKNFFSLIVSLVIVLLLAACGGDSNISSSNTLLDDDQTGTHDHSYLLNDFINPTCTEAGRYLYTCSCGDTYSEEIAATGHSFSVATCTQAPTCSCGAKNGSALGHSFNLNLCTRCGLSKTDSEYSDHPGKEHIFDNEESVLIWPTATREGCYGKRCNQSTVGTGNPCKIVQKTKTIPKRTGNYSSIDPAFKVEFSDDDPRFSPGYGECYKMIDIPQFTIMDQRIFGAVPTIKYNKSEKNIVVTAELRDGLLHTSTFDVQYIIDCINDGCLVSGWIDEDEIRLQVGRLSGSGG